ncbi:hypothetical protein XENOCAPTIV_015197 [Xenoophorus captivus]|uniref:Uncharacterized protein n=1 Tax=Xenoophorus captivus TaxID=1517983 RepID=A0ABV0R3R9_9TELE
MEFACSHVVCNWGPDGAGISQFGPNYENITILKQQTDALPPPLPPRRFRKPRPTSLPNPPFSPSHLPVTPLSLPPPVPPRLDLLEGENRFKVNINVVSLSVGKLADISQDAGLESFQSPVICGKCSAALSCLSSVWEKVKYSLVLLLFSLFFQLKCLISVGLRLLMLIRILKKHFKLLLSSYGYVSSVDMKTVSTKIWPKCASVSVQVCAVTTFTCRERVKTTTRTWRTRWLFSVWTFLAA